MERRSWLARAARSAVSSTDFSFASIWPRALSLANSAFSSASTVERTSSQVPIKPAHESDRIAQRSVHLVAIGELPDLHSQQVGEPNPECHNQKRSRQSRERSLLHIGSKKCTASKASTVQLSATTQYSPAVEQVSPREERGGPATPQTAPQDHDGQRRDRQSAVDPSQANREPSRLPKRAMNLEVVSNIERCDIQTHLITRV